MTRKSFVGQFKPLALLDKLMDFMISLSSSLQTEAPLATWGGKKASHDVCIFLPANWCSTRHVRVHLGLNWGGKGKKIVDCLFLTFFCCSGSSWADYGAVEQWDGSSLEETPRRDVRDYDCCFYFYLWLVKGKVKFYILTFSDQLILNLFFLF